MRAANTWSNAVCVCVCVCVHAPVRARAQRLDARQASGVHVTATHAAAARHNDSGCQAWWVQMREQLVGKMLQARQSGVDSGMFLWADCNLRSECKSSECLFNQICKVCVL